MIGCKQQGALVPFPPALGGGFTRYGRYAGAAGWRAACALMKPDTLR